MVTFTAPDGYPTEPTTEQKQRYALRQCYMLAIREARREQKADDSRSSTWNHIIQFCKDADEDGNICGGSVLRQSAVPDEWEGDLATDHPNRCKLRDTLLYADIFNDDGSHRAAWRCHKRAGHDGPCSSHNDCGVMNGGVVCGKLPGHVGPHAWATEITVY